MSKARIYTSHRVEDALDYETDDESDAGDDFGYYEDGYYEEAEDDSVGLFSSPGRAIMLIASIGLLLLVAGMVAWLLGSQVGNSTTNAYTSTGITNTSGLQTAPRVGALAPDFVLNEIYTGKPMPLSSLRGKPVWVNFWASWCGPCKAEMPEMKQRYAKYKDKGLVILGVDDREDNATVKQFTELNGYDWTFVIDGDGSVLEQYFVSGIPTHVFVDKAGVIRSMTIGGISGDMMDDGLAKIMNQ